MQGGITRRGPRRPAKLVFLWLLLAGGLAERGHSVEIIAHRGASHDAPENTLAAVRLAWERDADAVEIDVHLTRDGRIVVTHDATTGRTAERDWAVAERTLAELRTLDAGSWKDPQWAGEKLPALEEILATIPDCKRLFIEIKCKTEIVPELKRVLKASGKRPGQTAVISFDLDTVSEVKRRMPGLKTYWVHGPSPKRDEKTGQPIRDPKTGRLVDPPDELIETCRRAGLDGLDLAANSQLTAELVDRMHRLGLALCVWTIDDPEHTRKLVDLGVDGITTNRPGWLREQLDVTQTANK
jgi:glycerophosphoryl diester phosphodiesterase